MQKVNPWTGKTINTSHNRSNGKFISICEKHYPHLVQKSHNYENPKLNFKQASKSSKNHYKKISELIQAATTKKQGQNEIPRQYINVFDIKSKIKTIQKLDKWLQKQKQESKENNNSNNDGDETKNTKKDTKQPIQSSYVYLPIYSGNIFPELLKQSSSLWRQPLIHDRQIKQIKSELQEMQKILTLNDQVRSKLVI